MMQINDEHLKELEDEAIFVMREVAAQFEKKVILFSGGKDSIVLVHLARKAFWPARIPFSLMHIDTGHNLGQLKFRDDLTGNSMRTIVDWYRIQLMRERLLKKQA
jgi:sulfate adenylyltransferase subunit 2